MESFAKEMSVGSLTQTGGEVITCPCDTAIEPGTIVKLNEKGHAVPVDKAEDTAYGVVTFSSNENACCVVIQGYVLAKIEKATIGSVLYNSLYVTKITNEGYEVMVR